MQREQEKKKIKDAILMHKQEEVKQTKFIGHQNKNRQMNYLMQQAQENELKNKMLRQ